MDRCPKIFNTSKRFFQEAVYRKLTSFETGTQLFLVCFNIYKTKMNNNSLKEICTRTTPRARSNRPIEKLYGFYSQSLTYL